MKELIARLRNDRYDPLRVEAADALERLTQPVDVEPVAWMLDGLTYPVQQTDFNGVPHEPQYALYSAETVARLQQERDHWQERYDDIRFETMGVDLLVKDLQEQVKMLRGIAEGIKTRMLLRGFYMPQDTADLIAALIATEPKEMNNG